MRGWVVEVCSSSITCGLLVLLLACGKECVTHCLCARMALQEWYMCMIAALLYVS
jgi:hypothetical protein